MSAAAGLALSTKELLQRIHSWILCFDLLGPRHALLFPVSVVCPEDNLPGQHARKVAASVFCR